MKSTNMFLVKLAAASAVVLCGSGVARAASGSWNGTAGTLWADSNNWSASPYPSGDDTATFNGAGNSNTAIDLAGLAGILNITFDTASAAGYTLGTGGANAQTLVMGNNGMFQMTDSVVNGQAFAAAVEMGPSSDSTYTLQNNSAQTLTFNNVVGTGGNKWLNVNGNGPIAINGNLSRGPGSLYANLNGTGTLTLSGSDNQLSWLQINGAGAVINLAAGSITTFNGGGGDNIKSAQNCTINGPGGIVLSTGGGENYADNGAETGTTLTINAKLSGADGSGFEYWHGSYRGTIALLGDNDFAGQVIMNVPGTISCTNINNQGVSGNLGAGQRFAHNGAGSRLLYTGPGCTTDRIIEMRQDGIVEQGGSGNLNFTSQINAWGGDKTLTLQGSTAGTGEFSGALRNDGGQIHLKKEGTGTWTLSAANPYTGATTINGGKVFLSGASGAITGSSSLTLAAGSELKLDNTDTANNADRLRDAMPVMLNGATLTFANNGGAVSYSETVGTLAIGGGASTIAVTEAANGSSLTLSGLVNAGGTVNFTGTNIGTAQNRIFITGQANGLMGTWATVNGTSYAAYDSVNGVYAATTTSSNIAARGPDSVIPDNASEVVHITTPGTSGPITLAGATENSVFVLQQDTGTGATVDTVGKTLKASQVQLSSGQANLTIGSAQGDGALSALYAGGALVLANNDAASLLTVNAAVNDNTSASVLTKSGTGKVLLTGPLGYTGATGIGGGTLAFGGSLTQTLASVISGTGTLSKEGSGKLTLSGPNTYTGPTTIKSGIVVAQNNTAFGSAAAGTVVESGATLDIGGSLGGNVLNLGTELFTISGNGVNDMGAIVANGDNDQFFAFGKIELAADAAFGGTRRWDLRENSASLNMNSHTLTKVGNNNVCFVNTTVTPGSGLIDIASGTLQIEGSTRLNGSSANTMHVESNATLGYWYLYDDSNTTPWQLILENQSTVLTFGGDPLNNVWRGPVTLNGLAYLNSNGRYQSFSGPISGAGSLEQINSGNNYLNSINNTYEGTTTVSGGTLYPRYPGSLPGYASGKVTVKSGGTLAVYASDGTVGWNSAQIGDLVNASTFTAANAALGIDTSLANLNYGYAFPALMGLTKLGTGSLTLDTAGQSLVGQIKALGGELNMTGISVNPSNTEGFIAQSNGENARLTLAGNTVWSSIPPDRYQAPLYIGNSGRGVLVVKDNVAFTNRFNVGQNGDGAGAVYQSGGSVVNWGGGGTDGRIGQNGYGYYELGGGALTFKGWSQLGVAPASVGILKVSGGTFTQLSDFDGALGLSRGGTGVVYVTSGTFTTSISDLWVGDPNENGESGGFADFTLAGGTVTVNGGTGLQMANRHNMAARVNLNGGILQVNQIRKEIRNNSSATVGFNGGTLLARVSGALFGSGSYAPDAVSIYAGGAAFDTASLGCSIAVPLLAPAGNGVTGIGVASTPGYIGPPMVTITGGDGTGATAVALFDSASGTLTGIQVTCSGFGYTSAPTVSLSGGGLTTAQPAATASIGASASGGLTKLGSGTLALLAANTYAGATTVSNGTLRVGTVGALPKDTDVNVAGGTLDMGGFSLTNRNVTVTGGAIFNGSLASDSFTKTGSGTLTLAAPLSSTAPIVVSEGTLKLQGILPGLYEGVVSGNFELNTPNPSTAVQLTTTKANTTAGWTDNTTAIYSGFIWNRTGADVTWTFAENFDDNVRLTIDATTVIDNGVGWDVPVRGTITLSPGAHAFEARFGQGGGGAGPVNSSWWTTTDFGFGIDTQGRDEGVIGNYQPLVDPGDGSLLTLTAAGGGNLINSDSSVVLGETGVVDLGTLSQTLVNLSGGGIISNGNLAVTGEIVPGGDGPIDTLAVNANVTGTAKLLVDVATDGTSDLLAVQGNVDLSGMTLEVANPGQLDSSKQYTVLTCAGTRTGAFSSVTLPSRWHVVYRSDGSVKLVYINGTLIQVL